MKPDIENCSPDAKYRAWKDWSSDGFAKYTSIDSRYYESELSHSGINRLRNLNCLELGFGNGQFAAWAIDNGMRYVGTELNSELLALAKSKGIIGIEARYDLSKLIEPESLDLVVAFDVLEHLTLQEIADLFSSVKNCLKDGGHLIARFPSGDSPFSRAIQYGDMTHKSIIGSLMIRQLATEAGFQVLQVREPSFPIRGLGPIKFFRRLPIVCMRYVTTRFINLFFNDNMPMVISPNMLVVLQK